MAEKIIANCSNVDPRSGFCQANTTFYSKRKPIPLPSIDSLDITTFISSHIHHDKIAFIDSATGQKLTFTDLWRSVDSVATCLSRDNGIHKGQTILILSPNSIYFPIVCLAVMSLGAVITTTNPLNTPREIAKQIRDSKPVLIFTTPQLAPKLADSNLPIVLLDSNITKIPKSNELRIVTSIQEMMKSEPTQSRVKKPVYQDDMAALMYSSGTTGESKGVVFSHRNLIAMVQAVTTRFRSHGDSNTQTFICTVPMFHMFGFAAFVTSIIAYGSTVVILPKFGMDEMLTAIEKFQATYLFLVPPILVVLMNNAETIREKYDLSSLRHVLCGGAPLSKELMEGLSEKYPTVTIYQGYGLTESAGIGATMDSSEETRKYGAAGLLAPNMEAKIVDPESGEALPVNRTGEIWLRGPTIMKGYFNNIEATAATLNSEGWLKTGDLCYIDEDGFVFIVDRLKELIKYKGYQVPPAELEALLLTHLEIADAAVIPFPDEEVGQIPMAYVVRKTGSTISANEVMDFIAKQVAPYKKIRRVAFLESIPKNPSGKILRKDLIKLAVSEN